MRFHREQVLHNWDGHSVGVGVVKENVKGVVKISRPFSRYIIASTGAFPLYTHENIQVVL